MRLMMRSSMCSWKAEIQMQRVELGVVPQIIDAKIAAKIWPETKRKISSPKMQTVSMLLN